MMNRDEIIRWIDAHAQARVAHGPDTARLLLRDEAARLDGLEEALGCLATPDFAGRGALGGEDPREAAENLDEVFVECLEGALPLRAVAGRGPCDLVGGTDPDAYATLLAHAAVRDELVARELLAEDGEILDDAWCAYARHEVTDGELADHRGVVVYRTEVAS